VLEAEVAPRPAPSPLLNLSKADDILKLSDWDCAGAELNGVKDEELRMIEFIHFEMQRTDRQSSHYASAPAPF
jgi:hypothetical protein